MLAVSPLSRTSPDAASTPKDESSPLAAALALAACCFFKPLMLFRSSFRPPRLRRASRPSPSNAVDADTAPTAPRNDGFSPGDSRGDDDASAPSSAPSGTVGTRSRSFGSLLSGKSIAGPVRFGPRPRLMREMTLFSPAPSPLCCRTGVARNAIASMDMPPTRGSRCA